MTKRKTDKITVMHLIGTLGIGGAEQALLSLAPHFDPEKFRIIVCTLQPGGRMEDRLDLANVDLKTIGFRLQTMPFAIWRLRNLIKKEKVDILHMHMYGAGLYGRIAGILAGRPVMLTTDHGKGLWKKPRQVAFDIFANRFTDLKIAVSHDILEILKKRERVTDDKVIVIPNGVDVDRFKHNEAARQALRTDIGITDENVLVGTLARLVEPKALHVMIESISHAVKECPQLMLAIVGDGPLMADLKKCASDFGITNLVIFTGARSDIPEVLSAIDIYAISSIREGLPVSLLEAMAAGKPIVATKVGGIPETVIDHHDGLLVDSENPKAMAAAICELVNDRQLAAQLGENAQKKTMREYSIAAVIRTLEKTYSSLISSDHQNRS